MFCVLFTGEVAEVEVSRRAWEQAWWALWQVTLSFTTLVSGSELYPVSQWLVWYSFSSV